MDKSITNATTGTRHHVLPQQWNKLRELLKDKEDKDDKAA